MRGGQVKTQSQEDGKEIVHKCFFFSLNRSSRGLENLRRRFLRCRLLISMTEWWGMRDISLCICNCTCTCTFTFFYFSPRLTFPITFSSPAVDYGQLGCKWNTGMHWYWSWLQDAGLLTLVAFKQAGKFPSGEFGGAPLCPTNFVTALCTLTYR